MRKKIIDKKNSIVLTILLTFIVCACQQQPTDYKILEPFNYSDSSKIIVDINEKTGNNTAIEAAKLNLELSKEKSLSKKAALLVKINHLSKDTSTKN